MIITKRNKQERIHDILEAHPDQLLTTNEVMDYWDDLKDITEKPLTYKSIYNAVYRRQSKGYPVEIVKLSGKEVCFRYNKPKTLDELAKANQDPAMDYTLDNAPIKFIQPEDNELTIDESAGDALEVVQEITKPVIASSEPDIFSTDEEIEANSPVDGLFGNCDLVDDAPKDQHEPDETLDDFAPNGYDYQTIGNYANGSPVDEIPASTLPEITDEAVMHLVKASRPVPVTPLTLQTHFGVSANEAIALLLNLQERGYMGIKVTVSAVAY